MDVIKRVFGYIHVILGVTVAAQFLTSEIYDDNVGNQIWDILNYLMAIGVIAALLFSYLRSRDADKSNMPEWIASSVMLIASAALFLLFIEQWFASTVFYDEGDGLGESRSVVWIMVDVMFPIVNITVGSYLLRKKTSRDGS